MNASSRQTFKRLLLAATILASPLIIARPFPAFAQFSIGISVQIEPPVLPVYDQPPIPDVGYIWTPGFWAWAQDVGYFWVPGTWVQPPAVGMLWTPAYWSWEGGVYVFHEGYWAPEVGFYGGIDYGFGYGGEGFEGGRWDNGNFLYNRAANNFGSVHVTNVYEARVTVVNTTNVSFVGGTGGTRAQPTAQDRQAEHVRHIPMTAQQTSHISAAAKTPSLAANQNNGHPAIAATSRPAQFEGAGVTHPRAASTKDRAATSAAAPQSAVSHPVQPAASPQVVHAPSRPPETEPVRPAAQHPAVMPAPATPDVAPRRQQEPAELPAPRPPEPPRPSEAARPPAEAPRAPEPPHLAQAVRPPEAARPPAGEAPRPPQAAQPVAQPREPAPADKEKKPGE
jgi:hypothetical protein